MAHLFRLKYRPWQPASANRPARTMSRWRDPAGNTLRGARPKGPADRGGLPPAGPRRPVTYAPHGLVCSHRHTPQHTKSPQAAQSQRVRPPEIGTSTSSEDRQRGQRSTGGCRAIAAAIQTVARQPEDVARRRPLSRRAPRWHSSLTRAQVDDKRIPRVSEISSLVAPDGWSRTKEAIRSACLVAASKVRLRFARRRVSLMVGSRRLVAFP